MDMKNRFRISRMKNAITCVLMIGILGASNISVVNAEELPSATSAEVEEVMSTNITRYEGARRENVAENVAKAHFANSKKVILVNQDKFPDAISATNLSQGRYPVLYTRADKVSVSTMDLLKTMPLDEIYILGGTHSVSEKVISQLKDTTGVKITRMAGKNRYDANANAVQANFTNENHVVIASGEVFSDALYGVSYANTINAPVILTKTNKLEASTIKLLKDLGVEVATIIGGKVTVTAQVENELNKLNIKHTRIAGENRYIGSAEVAAASYANPTQVVVASGEVFSDALVSAPLAQKLNAPILLTRNNSMDKSVTQYLESSQLTLENIYIQGGPLTISKNNQELMENLTTYTVVSKVLPIETETQEDDTVLAGQTTVVQEGQEGFEEIFYKVSYENGVETGRTEFDRITKEAVPKMIKVGTRVDVESVEFTQTELTLVEEESATLSVSVFPENATNKKLIWTSSDEKVLTVNEKGVVQARNTGESIVTVSDSTGNITSKIVVTVVEPTISSIDNITSHVTQFDEYKFPTIVTAKMTNGAMKEYAVRWSQSTIDTSILGTQQFEGKIEGYEQTITLTVMIEKYDPEIQAHAYSMVTVSGLSKNLSMSLRNNGQRLVEIQKIEIYERGKLFTTITPESLHNSDINTILQPGEYWSISYSHKVGLWLNNSYVRYYVTANNTNYEYEVSLDN